MCEKANVFEKDGNLYLKHENEEIQLSPDDIMVAYRFQQKHYAIDDAQNQVEDLAPEMLYAFTENDFEAMAEEFLNPKNVDCNVSENDRWETIVKARTEIVQQKIDDEIAEAYDMLREMPAGQSDVFRFAGLNIRATKQDFYEGEDEGNMVSCAFLVDGNPVAWTGSIHVDDLYLALIQIIKGNSRELIDEDRSIWDVVKDTKRQS